MKPKTRYEITGDHITAYSKKGEAFKVDIEDEQFLIDHSWYIDRPRENYSSVASCYKSDGKTKKYTLSRLIMRAPKGMVVDHINGDSLDNRRKNLRVCTNQQNLRNRRGAMKNNTLGILGVQKVKNRNLYLSVLYINGEKVHNKTHKTIEEAVKERIKAEKKYFGKFAPRRDANELTHSEGGGTGTEG